MSVSVEITSSLGRRLTVNVPVEQVENAVKSRLGRIAQTAKIDGFRKGKVPVRVIAERFGAAARGEAVEELLESTLRKALQEEKLVPAETPTVQSLKAEPGMPLEYSVTFDIYPEVQLKDLSTVSLEKLVVSIQDPDIDQVIDQMRKLHTLWEDVQRPAQMGDRLTVDLQGIVGGSPAAELTDKNVHLVLDAAAMPPGFEVLEGTQAGDNVTIDLPVRDAQSASQVIVTVHGVAESKLPELDAEFAKKMGVAEGDITALRGEVCKHMEQELANFLRNELKEQLLEALIEHHTIELPKQMVEEEYRHLEQDLAARMKQENPKSNLQLPKADREKLQDIARRRVTLGLIFPAVVQQQNLKVDQKRMAEHVQRLAGTFEDGAKVIKSLTTDKNMMAQVQSQVLEEQVVDYLLGQVRFIDKTMAYQDVLAMSKGEHRGHKHHGHRYHPSDAPVR